MPLAGGQGTRGVGQIMPSALLLAHPDLNLATSLLYIANTKEVHNSQHRHLQNSLANTVCKKWFMFQVEIKKKCY